MKKRLGALLLAVPFLSLGLSASSPSPFVFFPIAERGADEVAGVCLGPDGNVWFTTVGNAVGRISLTGEIRRFSLPRPMSRPTNIVAGPDGNLWFVESGANQIGRISPSGSLTEFPVPGPSSLYPIAAGPDGALWFSDFFNGIWRITTSGQLTKFILPLQVRPWSIAAGSDGNLWFTNSGSSSVGRVTLSGVATLFSRPPLSGWGSRCALGPDGSVWYGTFSRQFGRIEPSGEIRDFGLDGNRGAEVTSVAVGPDGNLWMPVDEALVCPGSCQFDWTKDAILRVTPDGVQTRYELPENWLEELTTITAGPGESMWFGAGHGLVRFFPVQLAESLSVPAMGNWARVALLGLLALAGLFLLRR